MGMFNGRKGVHQLLIKMIKKKNKVRKEYVISF